MSAQYRASLQGTITDQQGAVIPDASVKLTSSETQLVKTVTSSNSGVYTVNGLAPGQYRLEVEKTGFASRQLNNVLITSEQAQAQDVQLDVAQQRHRR